ncbi:hypothetical protein [Amycolatopsis pigmentata]|uniref:Uncharacterized protein n=1 Tax=Amycolatopsis pigmentata TaxID=450801 RepID=A0ABW5G509_9PSEU
MSRWIEGFRYQKYTDATRARIVLAAEASKLADLAAELVPIREHELRGDGSVAPDGTWVETAARVAAAAQELLTRAVVFARVGGISWQRVGDELEISRQSAHERYADAERRFRDELAELADRRPPDASEQTKYRLHPAAQEPETTAWDLDEWVARRQGLPGSDKKVIYPVSQGLRSNDQRVELAIRHKDRGEPVNHNSVHLERASDYKWSGAWRVVTIEDKEPILVGYLSPKSARSNRQTAKKWYAITASEVDVPGGPWKTRKEALLHLLSQHQTTQ